MLESILRRIDEWRRLGFKESPNGSRIVGHTPRDFPEAYLHTFFTPQSRKAWEEYGFRLPPPLQGLYSECNGLSLFHEALVIYGIRKHYNRDDSAQFQPFDLIDHNQEHRGAWHPLADYRSDRRVFFGSYSDGSGIYVEAESPKVHRVIRGKVNPSNEWAHVESFLQSEYDRISNLFTSEGYLLREDFCTAPDATRRK